MDSRSSSRHHRRSGSGYDDRSPRGSASSYGTPDRRRLPSVDHSLYGVATNAMDVDRGPGGATNILNDKNNLNDQTAGTPPLIIHNDVSLPTEVRPTR